jgi:uncharacterized membrane protein YcjF (UPF0283 family)
MWNTLQAYLSSHQYIPHGHCYLWQTPLVWLHVIGDSLIAIAYFAIPATLIYFVSKRKDVPFNNIFLLFSALIFSCGITHIFEVWTLWYAHYWLSGLFKAITALISVYTALELISVLPKIMGLFSLTQLEKLNQEMQQLNSELDTVNQQIFSQTKENVESR